MPDTNGARMLTVPETRLANRAAVSPADRMHTPAIMPPASREPPRRPVTARETTSRPAKSWLGRGVLIAGLAMIPWVLILACSLPPTIRAAHWSTAWAGLDALEAAGLMTTGAALIGRCSWLCLPAAITSTLLVADAWSTSPRPLPVTLPRSLSRWRFSPNSRSQACARRSPSVTHRAVLPVTDTRHPMNI